MAAATTNVQDSGAHGLDTAGVWKGAAIGAAAGALGNVVLFLVAGAAGVSRAAEFVKGQPVVELALPQVAIASLVPGVAAALFAMVLNAIGRSPARVFLGVSIAFGLLSLGGPLSLPGASLGLKVMLELMHVVSGVAIAGAILRYGRR